MSGSPLFFFSKRKESLKSSQNCNCNFLMKENFAETFEKLHTHLILFQLKPIYSPLLTFGLRLKIPNHIKIKKFLELSMGLRLTLIMGA